MCGLVAVIGDPNLLLKNKYKVEQALKVLEHRGPDEQHIYLHKNQIYFGHARLSIIDSLNGSQPFKSEDERYSIVFNGAIYNFVELKKFLQNRGVNFRTNSDTEVLLKGLILEGKKFVSRLVGMFAFVFNDSKENHWIAARDHLGMKPLYYAQYENLLIFSSELKAMSKFIPKLEPNFSAVNDYLTFQFYFDEETIYRSIYKLMPGQIMSGHKRYILETEYYWKPTYVIRDIAFKDSMEQIDEMLNESVKMHLRSDVKPGVYLSGGLDSSLISAIASNYEKDIISFHGYFDYGSNFNESEYAKSVASKYGIRLECLEITKQNFLDELVNISDVLEEPLAGPGSISQLILSRKVSAETRVILGGQGGDELFAGYIRYFLAYLEQAFKGAILGNQDQDNHLVLFKHVLPHLASLRNYEPMIIKFFSNGLFEPMDKRYLKLVERSTELKTLIKAEILENFNALEPYEKFMDTFNSINCSSYLNKMLNFDLKTSFQALLQVEDRVSMAASIESRLPFLDHRFVDYVNSIPPLIKYNHGESKYLLKQLSKKYLPQELVLRQDKMGFPVPLTLWMQDKQFKNKVMEIIDDNSSFFDKKKLDTFIQKDKLDDRILWGILQIGVWWEKNC